MVLDCSDLKKGLKLDIDGVPYLIVDFQFVKPGKGQALYHCKMKNLITGLNLDRTYRSGESFKSADTSEQPMQFLYQDADGFHFMDTQSYEQVALSEDSVGDAKHFLMENMDVSITYFNERPIDITLPNSVNLKITYTEPGVRGNTVSGALKNATVETGYIVKVPLFVEQDEVIRIDTRTGEYIERVKV